MTPCFFVCFKKITPWILCTLALIIPEVCLSQKLLDPASASGPISVVVASSGGSNTSIAVAYSIRQLKTTYDHSAITPPAAVTGFTNSSTPLIRVLRSFDNAQLDIGYDGNGNLDTVTLKNFVSGKVGLAPATNPTANGRVTIWYDQSGNSRDATLGSSTLCAGQAVTPFIISAGVIERNGGGQIGIAGQNGGMLGDGGTSFDASPSGFNRYGIVNNRTQNIVSQPRTWSNGSPGAGDGTYLVDRNGGSGAPQDPPLTSVKAVNNNWALQVRNEAGTLIGAEGIVPISINRSDNVTIVRSADVYSMYVNGVLAGSTTLAGNNSMSPVRIGYGCPFGEDVYYGEFILFPSALSNANLTAINTSQNNYFALGGGPFTWTGATSSDWTVASNWNNNQVPSAIDEVEIPSGTVNNLIITGGQTTLVAKKLTIVTGATVTIDGNLSINGNAIINGTITGSGTLTMSGAFDQSIAGTPSINLSNLVISNTTDTCTVNSDLNITGTLTINSGSIFSIGQSNVINDAGAAGTITGSGTALVTRIASTADFQSQYKFSTYTLTNLAVNYAGTGAQIINLGVDYSTLLVSGTGVKTLSAAITATNVSGNISVNSGTLFTNNFNIASPTNRTITIASGAVFDAGTSVITFGTGTKTITINGTFRTGNVNGLSGGTTTAIDNTNTPTITIGSTSTIEYYASSTQTVTARTDYGNIALTNGSKTISGTNTLAGSLTIGSGATYDGAANPVLNIGGNFTNNGTYTSGTGTVTFNGLSAQTINSVTTPLVFGGAVVFSGASSTATMQVNATTATTLNVNAGKTLNLATFSFNRASSGGTLTVAGTLQLGSNTGGQTGSNFPLNFTTNTLTGGTIEYNGSNAITQTVFATPTYTNLVLTNGSGTGNAAKISTSSFTVGGTMTVNSGATMTPTSGNIITGTGGTLTGTGTVEITGGVALATQYAFTTLTLTNLTVTYVGSSNIAAGTYANINITTGTATVTGTITVTGNITIGSGTTLAAGTNNINIAGNWINNGSYTTGAATVTFNGTTTQSIGGSASTAFSSLTISNTTATITVNTNIDISATLTVNANATLIPDAGVVLNNAAPAGTITGNGTIHVTRIATTADYQNQYRFSTNTLTNLTTNYAGAGNQTINLGVNYGNLVVSGSGIKTLSAAITATNVTGSISVNAATLATADFNIASPTNRTITIAVGATLDAGASTISFGAGTRVLNINGTIQLTNISGFSGASNTTINVANPPTINWGASSLVVFNRSTAGQVVTTFNNYGGSVTLLNASKTIAADATLVISGNLTIETGATYLGTSNNPTLNLGGNLVNNGTFNQGTNLLTLNGATQTIGGSSATQFTSLTVSSTVSATLLANITVSGNLTVSSGRTFDLSTFTCNRTAAGGTLTIAGTMRLGGNTGGQTGSNFPLNFSTITLTGGTVEYNGSNSITQTIFATPTYNNLTLTNGSGSGTATKISTSNLTINTGNFTVNSNTEFNPTVGNTIGGTGTLTGTGTIYVNAADVATQYPISTRVLTNLTIIYSGANQTIAAGTYASLNVSGGGTKTLGGTVTVTGNVNIATLSDTLACGTNTLNVAGNWSNNGVFTAGTGTVVFNGTASQSISGTSLSSFNNLTISNTTASIILNRSINVSGTLNLNGAATSINPNDTTVINNAVAAGTLTGTGTIFVTRTASVADLVNQYKFTTYTLTSLTVNYAGAGNQTINNTVGTYGSLSVSGSGTKTLQGNITSTGAVTLTSGTLAFATFALTTSGNWVNNGVTLSGTGTVNLNGTGRTISGTAITAFPAIVIGAGATYTMNNNNTATSLTFTASGTASSLTHGTNNTFTINGAVNINQPTADAITTAWNINIATVTINGTLTLGGSNNTASRVARVAITTGSLTITGNTTFTTGTSAAVAEINLSGGAATLNFGGTVNNAGTLTPGTSSTVTYNGTVAQTIRFSASFTYNVLRSANSSVSGANIGAAITTINLVNNLTVVSGLLTNTSNFAITFNANRTLTVSAGATFDAGTIAIAFGTGCTVTINGTFRTANTAGFSGAAGTAISSTNTPTITLGTNSTVNYNAAAGGQTVTTALSYSGLTMGNTSGTQTPNGNLTVSRAFTTTTGGTIAFGTANLFQGSPTSITHNGNLTTNVPTTTSAVPITSGLTWSGTGTITYGAAAGAQTIVAGTYNNLTLSNTSATNTAGGNININGTLTTTAGGTFAMTTFAMGGNPTTITNAGTITTTNTSATPLPAGENWGAGTVNYVAGTGLQTIVGGTYTTLTMGNTSGTQTASGNITCTTLNNNSGTTILNMASFTLAATTINNLGSTIQTQNTSATPLPTGITIGGTVSYNASAGGQTVRANTYTTLTLGNTSGTQTAAGDITATTVNNNTNTASILNMATFRIISATGINNTGTIRTQHTSTATPFPTGLTIGGTVTYDAATGGQTIQALTFTNVTVSNTSGTTTLINGGTINVSGAFTPGANAYTSTGNTFVYNGAGSQTVAAINYNNLTVSGARSTNSIITMSNGTIGIAATATFSATGTNLTWDVTGNTINYSGAAQTISTTFSYNNLTYSGSGNKTGAATVNGIFSLEGTAVANSVITYGASATLQYNGRGTYSATTNEWPATFSGEGGVILNGASTITLAAQKVITFALTINTGAVANLSTITTHTSGGLILNGANQVSGTHGGTGSGATNINTTFFAATTGRITNTSPVKTWVTSGTTSWNTGANWNPIGVPTNTNDVVIPSGGTQPSIDVAATCRNLTINSGATLSYTSGSLDIRGDFTNNGTATLGSCPITISGTLNQSFSGFTTTGAITITKTSGTTTFNGATNAASLTFNPGAATNTTLSLGNTLTLTGAFTVNSITGASSTVNLTGAGTLACNTANIGSAITPGSDQTTIVNSTLSNLTTTTDFTIRSTDNGASQNNATFNHNSGILTVGGSLTTIVAADVNCIATYAMGASAPQVNLSGATPFTNTGGTGIHTITLNGTGAIVNYNGTAAQIARVATYTIMKVNNTAGVTLATGTNNIPTLTIGDVTPNSIFNDGGFTISTPNTLNLVSGTYNLGSAGTATTWPAWTTTNISAGTTVAYVSGVAQTVSTTPTYANITLSGASTKTIAAGTLTATGNLTTSATSTTFATNNSSASVTGNISGSGAITMSSGTISIGGDWTDNGTFTQGTSTVNYNGTGAQTIGALTYNNLTVSGTRTGSPAITLASGTITLPGTFTNTATGVGSFVVTGNTFNYSGTGSQTIAAFGYNNLTVSGSRTAATITLASGNIDVAGIFSVTATGISGYTTTGNTFRFTNTGGGQSIPGFTFNNLTLNNTSGTNTAAGNLVVNGALNTATGGTLAMAGNTLTGFLTSATNNGTITSTSTALTPFTAGVTWGGTGTVTYAALGGLQNIMSGTYNNLTLSNTSANNTAEGNIVVNNTLTTTSGGTMVMGNFTLTGTLSTVTNAGSITSTNTGSSPFASGKNWGSGTIIYAATSGGQTVVNGTYGTLTLNNTSGTQTASGGTIAVTTLNNNNSNSTFNLATNALTATTVNNSGTIRTQNTTAAPIPTGLTIGGTLNYDATTGGQTIRNNLYTTLTLSNTSGTQTSEGIITATTLNISNLGSTLNMGTNALFVTTVNNSGTIRTQNTSGTPLPTGRTWSGTVNYDAATGGQTIVSATSYNNLTIGNSSGTNTTGGNLVVNGTFTTTAGGILDMGTTNTLSGTLTSISHNGQINTAVPTATSTTPIPTGRTWGGTVNYTATTGLQTVVSATYNNLTLSNTSGTQTAGGNLVVNGTLTTTAGTLAMSTNTLTGTLATITNNAIIQTTHTATAIPLATGKTWGGTGRVQYNTSGQTIVAGTYNCILESRNTTGVNTLGGDVVCGGDFRLSSGNVAIGSNTLTLNSTFTNTSGRLVGSNTSNLVIGGSGSFSGTFLFDQTTPNTTNRLNNFTLNRASTTVTLGDSLRIGGTFTPTAGTLATADRLIIASDANGTGRIAAVTATITGNIIAERFIPSGSRRWRFISSPVSGRTFADWQARTHITGPGGAANGFDATLSNQAGAYSYLESVTAGNLDSGWRSPTNINNNIEVGRGYRIFVRGDRAAGRLDNTITSQNAVTLSLTGTLNSGNITLPVTITSSGNLANDGWNLVGNPYPSPYDWNAHFDAGGANVTNISNTIYIYNPKTNSYSSFNATSDINVGQLYAGTIPSGSSFWVKVPALTPTPNLVFTESGKVASTDSTRLFKTDLGDFTMRIIANQENQDEIVIRYDNTSSALLDQKDILKAFGGGVQLSSYTPNNEFLAANVKPLNGNSDTIPLSIGSTFSGNHTFEFLKTEALPAGVSMYLLDQFTNTVTAIQPGTIYSFEIDLYNNVTKGNERFKLITQNEFNSAPEIVSAVPTITLFPSITSTFITLHKTAIEAKNTNVILTDMKGQKIGEFLGIKWDNDSYQIDLQNYASGIYLVTIIADDVTQTLKCVKQ